MWFNRTVRKRRKITDEAALYDYAVAALGRRMRSVAELKRLLRQRLADPEHGEALVEAVVARLKGRNYLNDTAFATAYSSYRRENDRFGRLRVISDLKTKGVHGQVIEQAVASAYGDADEEELARAFLRRKRLQKPGDQKHAARIFRTLARAGFGSRTIFKVLKNWDVDEETLSTLETEREPGGGAE